MRRRVGRRSTVVVCTSPGRLVFAVVALAGIGAASGELEGRAQAQVRGGDTAPLPPWLPVLPEPATDTAPLTPRWSGPPPVEAGTDVAAGVEGPPTAGLVDASLLEAQIRQNEQLVAAHRQILTWGGYIDFGFFAPSGSGAGYVQDYGHQILNMAPYTRYSWVFLGDILAPAVNSRGEVADLGDAPGVDRYDSINSRGAPGFVANEINLRLRATPVPEAIITASFNLTPRTGRDFALGDVFDVDLAQLEWLPTASGRTSVFVGKMESVLGIEYRDRKSDHRFGVTPSLIARYTTGTALGLKARTKLGADDWLVLAAALTNGSNTTEQFHFYDETDSNAGKTGSVRLSVRPPGLPLRLEVGVSGSYGAEDRTTSNRHAMWFFGPDVIAEIGGLALKAQWLKGGAPGDAAQDAYELKLRGGGYLEGDLMLSATWGLLGRIEYRDAFVALGTDRAYVTKSWRGTAGVRVVFNTWATLKAEYLHNGEYGSVPAIANDVFTSSLVLVY
jgi:hypothetical protein